MEEIDGRFVCSRCGEIITINKLKFYDKKRQLCENCTREDNLDYCITCGKVKPVKEYLGECSDCWNNSLRLSERTKK